MIHSSNTPTFGDLCEEFDEANKKDPIYNLVMRYLLRSVSSGLGTAVDFFLKQLCTKKANCYEITDPNCLHFIHTNTGTMKDIDGKIKAFESKLAFFLD